MQFAWPSSIDGDSEVTNACRPHILFAIKRILKIGGAHVPPSTLNLLMFRKSIIKSYQSFAAINEFGLMRARTSTLIRGRKMWWIWARARYTCMRVTTTMVVNQKSPEIIRFDVTAKYRKWLPALNINNSTCRFRNIVALKSSNGIWILRRTHIALASVSSCIRNASEERYLKQVLFGSGFRCVHYDIQWCFNAHLIPRTCQHRAHSSTRWSARCEENRESVVVGSLHKY